MIFRGLMGGGADVETTVHTQHIYPGQNVEGVVTVIGGHTDRDVNFIELALIARVEVETDDSEYDANVVTYRNKISGPFRLQERARHQVQFSLPLPYETPFNVIAGQRLHGVRVGLRTELDISRSVDKSDVDQLTIAAMPAHEAVLAGVTRLGFSFKGSDLERGRLHGSPLPFYQELEFHPPGNARGRINELEVKFVAGPRSLDVVLEVDRRGFFGSSDRQNRFTVDYAQASQTDWAPVLGETLNRVVGDRLFHVAPQAPPQPAGGYQQPVGGYQQQGHPQQGYQQPAAHQPPPAPTGPPPAPTGPPPQQYQQQPPPAPTGPPPAPTGPPPQQHQAPPAPAAPPTPPPAQQAPPPAPAAAAPVAAAGGGLNLSKGQNADLSGTVPGLRAVSVALSWDVSGIGGPVDIDASAVLLGPDGRGLSEQHVVFYNNLASPDGAVRHRGDSSGAGQGVDEQIDVDLGAVAPQVDQIAFVVSIHDGQAKGQNFSHVGPTSIRVLDQGDGRELARYDLADRGGETALVFGELYRKGGGWKFRAVGQGYSDGFAAVLRGFGLNP